MNFHTCVLDEEAAAECPDGHEHNNWVNLDVVLNYSVDQIFNMLFTDTEFFRTFLESIGTTGKQCIL